MSLEPPPLPARLPPPIPESAELNAYPPPLPFVPKKKRTQTRGFPNPFRIVASGMGWLFGLASLMIGLAVLAAIPILQFLSLGYLLEVGGRIARTGRIRDGFVGIRKAAKIGGLVWGIWLLTLPVRYVSSLSYDADIVDPGSSISRSWRIGLLGLTAITLFHILMACARGGKLRHFFWPFNFIWIAIDLFRGKFYGQARDAVWNFVVGLRLPFYFWLGVRGFIVAFAWLVVPVSLMAIGRVGTPIAGLIAFFGSVLLAIALIYLPFLQMRMARDNRLASGFAWLAVRHEYCRAPWAFAFSFAITLLFAVPLYLLKIEIVPREAAWLPGLVFITFILPARMLVGWALGRAARRDEPRHWFFRLTGRLPFLPMAGVYVLIVFFTQFTSWNGVFSLYEQHAFLVPVPFFGM